MSFTAVYVVALVAMLVLAVAIRGVKFAVAAGCVMFVLYLGLVMLVTRSM